MTSNSTGPGRLKRCLRLTRLAPDVFFFFFFFASKKYVCFEKYDFAVFAQGRSRISEKGVYFPEFISFFLKYPMKMK